eukprot:SAG31_NODE_7529_length_1664_cov_2.981470_2_plen_102_part_00
MWKVVRIIGPPVGGDITVVQLELCGQALEHLSKRGIGDAGASREGGAHIVSSSALGRKEASRGESEDPRKLCMHTPKGAAAKRPGNPGRQEERQPTGFGED